jgi:hypothetical protein
MLDHKRLALQPVEHRLGVHSAGRVGWKDQLDIPPADQAA